MMQALVTILIPHYKTLVLTKLCLHLLKKNTDLTLAKIIVIDNGSKDESTEYLRTLSWITLIEREPSALETPVVSHARALDLGLRYVKTPYVLSIHTDTLVKHPQWLEFLLKQMEKSPVVAGVGSWKLENKSFWQRMLKTVERYGQLLYYKLRNHQNHSIAGVDKNYYYLRSHCAMYRMDLLLRYQLHFADGDMVAGKYLHKSLVDAGYKMLFLSSEQLIKYVEHVNHATTILNPEISTEKRKVAKGRDRVEAFLTRFNAEELLNTHQ